MLPVHVHSYIIICHHLCSLSACGSTSPFPYSNWLDVGKKRLVVALDVGVVEEVLGVVMVGCVHVLGGGGSLFIYL